jgi:putative ABC transport system ATP-binding protein
LMIRRMEDDVTSTKRSDAAVAVIAARGLRKTHGRGAAAHVALDGVDLDVVRGELLVIRGPSGSGKSTLLHCLSGIATPDEGTVTVLDGPRAVELTALGEDARTDVRGRRMGLVFQSLNLLPALTVHENVQLPLVLAGDSATTVRDRVADALDAVGLTGRGASLPSTLSGGQQQRVAVARALVRAPDVVLADEPTGALDSEAEHAMLGLLRELVSPACAVVIVSHSPAVSAIADRVVELCDGRLTP